MIKHACFFPLSYAAFYEVMKKGIKFCGIVQHFSMIKPASTISDVKRTIADYFKKQVDVTVNLGRNKILRYCGELSGVYPALFTVSPNDKNFLGKTSYSYAEVLCGSVKIKPSKKAQ